MSDMDIWIFGSTSSLMQRLLENYPTAQLIDRGHKFFDDPVILKSSLLSVKNPVIIYNSAVLNNKNVMHQSDEEITNSIFINVIRFVQLIELLNSHGKKFKAIYIGSESAKKGSFDTVYWMSKSFGEKFVTELKLSHPESSILALSPSTIEDSNMTQKRSDVARLKSYKTDHPKQRFLRAAEVAEVICKLLEATDYLTNTVIELNGGKFARR